MNLCKLPIELLEMIFINSALETQKSTNFSYGFPLVGVNSIFRGISRDPTIKAKVLLLQYSLLKNPINNVHICQAIVQNSLFNPEVAWVIFSIQKEKLKWLPVIAEYASTYGHTELLKKLLNNKVCDFPSEILNKSLVQCSMCNHINNVKLLLDFPKIDVNYDQGAAISMASKYGWLEIVQLLISSGANVNLDDSSATIWAARNGHLEIVTLLVENGASVRSSNFGALSIAAEFGQTKIVTYLISQGADIHANDDFPLRWASVRGHPNAVTELCRLGANVNIMNDFSLRNAVKFGHDEVVKILLQNGANVSANNNECISAAIKTGNSALLKLLLSYQKKSF